MKRAISLLAPVILAFAAAHAAHADAPLITEARAVAEFHAIAVPGTLAVEVTVGKAPHVDVTGDPEQVAKVFTTVKDGVLVLDTKLKDDHQSRRRNHLRVIVTMPVLDAINVGGVADMKVTGLAGDRLAVDLPGTASLRLTGATGRLELRISGTGNVEAKTLEAKDATIDVGGTGAAALRATQSVAINVTGTGSVDVVGHPGHVTKHVSGLGSVSVH